MIVLVDQDGVLADFHAAVDAALARDFGHLKILPLSESDEFSIDTDRYPPLHRDALRTVYRSSGFYLQLPVVAGAAEALNAMRKAGHNVFICTSPMMKNPTCASDKIEWTERHLGKFWSRRVIITLDKTLVHGDVLIDDNPSIEGILQPSWRQVYFTRRANINRAGPRINSWDDWPPVLAILGDSLKGS